MREKIKTSSNTDKSPQITLFCLLRPSRTRSRRRHSSHSFSSPMDGWRATSVISSGVEGIRHGVALPFLAFFFDIAVACIFTRILVVVGLVVVIVIVVVVS